MTTAQLRAIDDATVATYSGLYAAIDGRSIPLGGPDDRTDGVTPYPA